MTKEPCPEYSLGDIVEVPRSEVLVLSSQRFWPVRYTLLAANECGYSLELKQHKMEPKLRWVCYTERRQHRRFKIFFEKTASGIKYQLYKWLETEFNRNRNLRCQIPTKWKVFEKQWKSERLNRRRKRNLYNCWVSALWEVLPSRTECSWTRNELLGFRLSLTLLQKTCCNKRIGYTNRSCSNGVPFHRYHTTAPVSCNSATGKLLPHSRLSYHLAERTTGRQVKMIMIAIRCRLRKQQSTKPSHSAPPTNRLVSSNAILLTTNRRRRSICKQRSEHTRNPKCNVCGCGCVCVCVCVCGHFSFLFT